MNQKILVPSLLCLVALLCSYPVAEAAFDLKHSVFGSGGASVVGSGKVLRSTLGQPAIGIVSNGRVKQVGFWYLVRRVVLVDVGETPGLRSLAFRLPQNLPNPFRSTTTIAFAVPRSGNVKLQVFDVRGRRVAMLVNGNLTPGEYSIVFHATGLASGTYLYRLEAEGFSETKKFVLLR